MNQRVGQVENDVKLQQFQCQTMSLGITGLRKELAEINDTRNDLKKKVEEAKNRIDDLEQYSRRNCLIFAEIKEAGEDEKKLHRFTLDRTHRLGKKGYPDLIQKYQNLGPSLQRSFCVYKCKRKLNKSGLTIMENLTKGKVDLLNEMKEAVGVKNT